MAMPDWARWLPDRAWIGGGALVAIAAIATFFAASNGSAALTAVAYENAIANKDAEGIRSTVLYETSGSVPKAADAVAITAALQRSGNWRGSRLDVTVVSDVQVTDDIRLITVSYRSGASMQQETLRLQRQPMDHAILFFPRWRVLLPAA
jgi:hypothetical protein